jgi:hypothetical protein
LINRPFCPDNAILAGFSGSFAQHRKVEKLGCLYPIEVSQVGCILDRGMVS